MQVRQQLISTIDHRRQLVDQNRGKYYPIQYCRTCGDFNQIHEARHHETSFSSWTSIFLHCSPAKDGEKLYDLLTVMIEEHGPYFRGPTSFRFVVEWCINVHGESYCSVLITNSQFSYPSAVIASLESPKNFLSNKPKNLCPIQLQQEWRMKTNGDGPNMKPGWDFFG